METTTVSQSIIYYNLGPISHIPLGEGRVFRVENTDIAIFHMRDGSVFATQATCPHRGGPLADGLLGAGMVLCPLHAYAFELSSGQALESSCANLRIYPVLVNGAGEILLTLAE